VLRPSGLSFAGGGATADQGFYITETESGKSVLSRPGYSPFPHWLKFVPLRLLVEMKIAQCMRPLLTAQQLSEH
jgi:hypothetical protein